MSDAYDIATKEQVMAFLDSQQYRMTQEQWNISYQSWLRGGHGWSRYQLGGTYINAALAWYQHLHRPNSKEWRPPIIMRSVQIHALAYAHASTRA